jgi:endonuclease G
MKNNLLALFFFLSFQSFVFGQQGVKKVEGTKPNTYRVVSNPKKQLKISRLEIPKTKSSDKIISHTGYSLLYNEKYKQANWVAYELTKEETNKVFERSNKFISDPQVKSVNAFNKDYAGSGYDRGHLAPAADMGWSATSMIESFYYSNMSPQQPGFNRGIWKKLEELVRTWAIENKAVYVVTGPVLAKGLSTIGNNKIAVPNYYYKVILDYKEPNIKGIGFILPNESSKSALQNYAVSIDSVEKLTGIDFFFLLKDQEENLIEKELCINCWSWKSSKNSAEKNKAAVSVQCNGITKAGARCKNKTLNITGFCYHHEGQINSNTSKVNSKPVKKNSNSVQCAGITQVGNRCKRMTTNATGRCYQH